MPDRLRPFAIVDVTIQITYIWLGTKSVQHKRDTLILDHLVVVHKMARRLARKSGTDLGILKSAGTVGLIEAADRYDVTKNNKFATYAVKRIRGAMLDELRREDTIGRHERDIRKSDPKRSKDLMHEYNSRRVDISDSDTWENVTRSDGDQFTSLERYEFRNLLKILPRKHKQAMVMFYFEDKRDNEIGRVLGVTGSRICQIRRQAVQLIVMYLQKRGISDGDF